MIDVHSTTWLGIKAWAESELKVKIRTLESIHSDHDTTILTRGEVRALRKLLAIPGITRLPNEN